MERLSRKTRNSKLSPHQDNCQALVIADDSGLEVDALGGAPGIYSARYAGANATEQGQNRQITAASLREFAPQMIGVALDFAASWRSRVTAISSEPLKELSKEESPIEARGDSGFGYDPIFIPEGFEQTFGELPAEVKNTISHRAKAIRALADRLRRLELR